MVFNDTPPRISIFKYLKKGGVDPKLIQKILISMSPIRTRTFGLGIIKPKSPQ